MFASRGACSSSRVLMRTRFEHFRHGLLPDAPLQELTFISSASSCTWTRKIRAEGGQDNTRSELWERPERRRKFELVQLWYAMGVAIHRLN